MSEVKDFLHEVSSAFKDFTSLLSDGKDKEGSPKPSNHNEDSKESLNHEKDGSKEDFKSRIQQIEIKKAKEENVKKEHPQMNEEHHKDGLLDEMKDFFHSPNPKLTERLTQVENHAKELEEQKTLLEGIVRNVEKMGKENPEKLAATLYDGTSATKLLSSGIHKSGMLGKQQGPFHTWKTKYFLVKDKFLIYYDDKNDEKASGVILLEDQVVEKIDETMFGSTLCLSVTTMGHKHFFLASHEHDRNEWMDAISKAKAPW